MVEKCNYQKMEMCRRAKESGIISFGMSSGKGFKANIVGSGLSIDYCPYCGESLKDITISLSGYGESSLVDFFKTHRMSNIPIIPLDPSREEDDLFSNAQNFMMCMIRDNERMHKFQQHIDNLKKERDKLPEYAQDSLDAVFESTRLWGGCTNE